MVCLARRSSEAMDNRKLYQPGSVVWAKIAGRPWWPCVVFPSWEVGFRGVLLSRARAARGPSRGPLRGPWDDGVACP